MPGGSIPAGDVVSFRDPAGVGELPADIDVRPSNCYGIDIFIQPRSEGVPGVGWRGQASGWRSQREKCLWDVAGVRSGKPERLCLRFEGDLAE